ncbi:B2 bradykinin receptor [Oryzias melastigma]|uniref:B2 bradykinin receptor n=1 Tax=Oryzias melastigma TaxID=30732 RepID=A0A834CCF0_ORYME|nr:B2 bradykinin receptor [Oryzias melastigma]
MNNTGAQDASPALFPPIPENNTKENVTSLEWMYILIPPYISIITVLGFVLNVFVLMVFCLHKKASTVAEIYLTNLAAADLFLMCFLPLWAVNVHNRFKETLLKEFCTAFYVGIYMNAYCSIFFLVLVSVDRYLALVHPISHESLRRPAYAKVACFCVWIMGFLLSIPLLVYKDVELGHGCSPKYQNVTTPVMIETKVFICSFIIPIIIISFCTINILRALRKRSKNDFNIKKSDSKATTLILCVLLAFMICWIPYFLIQILEYLRESSILTDKGFIKRLEICKQIFPCLAVFNSVLNPFLYVLVGKNFRKKAKELFLRQSNERGTTTGFVSTRTYLTNSART